METIQTTIVKGIFSEAVTSLHSQKYQLASLKDIARIRLDSSINGKSNESTRVREAFIYLPEKGVYLSRYSPILEDPENATMCHSKGLESYLENSQIEKALKQAVKISNVNIPTGEFDKYDETSFAFGEYAKEYGLLLKKSGVSNMPIWLCLNESKAFARQAWIRDIGQRSILDSMSLIADTYAIGTKSC